MSRPYIRRSGEVVSGVYEIIAPTGNRYVGSSADVEERWSQHRRELRAGIHGCSPLQRAWLKYGDALVFRVILRCPADRLLVEEQALLDSSPDTLYNINRIASKVTHTPEVRRKLSLSGRVATPARKRHWAKLAVLSRDRIRQGLIGFKKGVQFPPEHFERLQAASVLALRDPVRMAARAAAISAAKKGRPNGLKGKKLGPSPLRGRPGALKGRPSPLRGRPSPLRGRKRPPEVIAKMALAKQGRPSPLRGRKRSPEAVAKSVRTRWGR